MKFNSRAFCFYLLNAVRLISIVSLLLVFSSSIFVIVTDVRAVNAFLGGQAATDMLDCDYIEGSDVPNQAAGVFWAVVNRLLIILEVIILLLSEVGWPMKFFDRFFPILGTEFGLGALGIFQSLIGASILSHHCDDFTLVSAFFLFCIGCVNMLLGLIWREKAKDKRSLTSWREEKKDILPAHTTGGSSFRASAFGGPRRVPPTEFGEKGYGFGRQGEKAAGLKGFILQAPSETLPRYSTRPISQATHASNTSKTKVPRPESSGSIFSVATDDEPEVQKMPVFKSSPTAF
ncbi:hypothetical protein K488DRAFT_77509 [Vararia minispora EC-137]|uniref:Uncharacterized protein n=1 Tax=Vararia minispora EC-137 TaxID=1314806 RepID=A0ACB8QQU3_9AGAM|nr:hypothetical protein K488DRAFT_77509 [Vararia minispora EC-137]